MWLPVLVVIFIFRTVYSQLITCVCLDYYLCPNKTVLTDGGGLIENRIGEPSCETCNCTGWKVCCPIITNTTVLLKEAPSTDGCGFTNPNGVAHQTSKSGDSLFGEFPWMVQIYQDDDYRCGGSLIHPSVVLTAAHCVSSNDSDYTVRAGEWDTSSTNELFPHQDRVVSSVTLHKNFNSKNNHNDIALLFLTQPFDRQAHINVACLPPEGFRQSDARCYSTGWGKKKWGPNQADATILKKVDLPIVERKRCEELFRKTRVGPYFNLHEGFVCAGGEEGKDVCRGDGGGPLVCPINGQENRYQQIGIVSWGLGCNQKDVPGAYVDVAVFRRWIEKQMFQKNFMLAKYQ